AGGSFIFIGDQWVDDSTAFVFKTDHKGNILARRHLFPKSDMLDFMPVSCFYENDHKIVLIGETMKGFGDSKDLWLAVIDSNLQVSYMKVIPFTNADTSLWSCSMFSKIGSSYYGYVAYKLSDISSPLRVKLVKLNASGDITLSRNLDSNFYGNSHEDLMGLSPITVSADNRFLNFIGVMDGYLTTIDTNFNLIDSVYMNTTFATIISRDTAIREFAATGIDISSSSMIIGPIAELRYSGLDDHWGVAKFDKQTKTIKRFGCFPVFSDPYNAKLRPTALLDIATRGNSVYTLAFTAGYFYKNSIVVCCYDTNANPKWTRRLSDSVHNFLPLSIYLCKDGSVMVNALSDSAASLIGVDARAQSIYVVRLDSASGKPLSMPDIASPRQQCVSVYPNPASSEICISDLQHEAECFIYNAAGQLLLHEEGVNKHPVDIRSLPSGSYYFTLFDKEKQQIGQGTFVKEE
ncbi:MAG: T9SS type A sorting domain-containing protein, partial [Chitinophagaceae bacterium]